MNRICTRLTILLAIIMILAIPARAQTIDLKEAVTPSGIKFRYLKSSAQDIVVIAFSFKGGTVHDLMKGPQTTFIAANMIMQSSSGIGIGTLIEEMNDLQSGIVIAPHPEYMVGTVLAPASNIAEVVKIANRVLTKPDFPNSKIEQFKEDMAKKVEILPKRPHIKASLKFVNLLGKPHPYAANYIGNSERIRAITRDDLVKWHRDRFSRDGLIVTVVGGISVQKMIALVDATFEGVPQKGFVPKLPKIEFKPIPAKPFVLNGKNKQAIIIAGGPMTSPANAERWTAVYLLRGILANGQKSRLFRNVREKTGKTYGFSSGGQPYSQTGILSVFGRVSKDGLDKTVDIVRNTLTEFRKEGPTAKEISDIKAQSLAADAKLRKNHDKLAHMLNRFERYGWSLDESRNYIEIDKAVDLTNPKFREALIPENPVFVIAN